MNKEALATILGVAGLSLIKGRLGSANTLQECKAKGLVGKREVYQIDIPLIFTFQNHIHYKPNYRTVALRTEEDVIKLTQESKLSILPPPAGSIFQNIDLSSDSSQYPCLAQALQYGVIIDGAVVPDPNWLNTQNIMTFENLEDWLFNFEKDPFWDNTYHKTPLQELMMHVMKYAQHRTSITPYGIDKNIYTWGEDDWRTYINDERNHPIIFLFMLEFNNYKMIKGHTLQLTTAYPLEMLSNGGLKRNLECALKEIFELNIYGSVTPVLYGEEVRNSERRINLEESIRRF